MSWKDLFRKKTVQDDDGDDSVLERDRAKEVAPSLEEEDQTAQAQKDAARKAEEQERLAEDIKVFQEMMRRRDREKEQDRGMDLER